MVPAVTGAALCTTKCPGDKEHTRKEQPVKVSVHSDLSDYFSLILIFNVWLISDTFVDKKKNQESSSSSAFYVPDSKQTWYVRHPR